MDSVKIQHNVIKKAQAKRYFTLSLSGLFSYPKDNPSRKRVARCTNILHTGATLSGVGEGQRLRKGFQEWLRVGSSKSEGETIGRTFKNFHLVRLDRALGRCNGTGLGRKFNQNPAIFESLSSAAKIRHSARNTRL